MKKGFKRLGIIVLAVLATVAVFDFALGKTLDWMLPQISNQGDTGKTYYSLYDVDTPAVIVGSSRAAYHYVTQMVEDSLGMPAYNVGRSGCFYDYNCCVMNSILDRYAPEVLIWECDRNSFYVGIDDPLEGLYPYYGTNQWATETIREELPWTEQVRLTSRTYRYNSSVLKVLMRYMSRRSFVDGTQKGYQSLDPATSKKSLTLLTEPASERAISETKVARFDAILQRAEEMGVKLIVADSPRYQIASKDNPSAEMMKDVCRKHGVLYLENTEMQYFLDHPELFHDESHLNDNGARAYTEIVIGQIKEYCSADRKF